MICLRFLKLKKVLIKRQLVLVSKNRIYVMLNKWDRGKNRILENQITTSIQLNRVKNAAVKFNYLWILISYKAAILCAVPSLQGGDLLKLYVM